jgi:serine/threonine-protein kinase
VRPERPLPPRPASIPRPSAREKEPGTASSAADGPQPADLFEAGKVIARKYVLERPAGFGGMSQVWVATNQATGAEVCVKLLVGGGEDADEAVERFRREAHAAAKLSHRAIVTVFDLLELDAEGEVTKGPPAAYAIVMELLHGETLGETLAKRGKLPLEEALDIFLPVVSALGHAHRASVIHRDVKPDNIFLARDPDGHVTPKVLDFGASKLESAQSITVDGIIVGTPSFMSPEQAKGARQIDARSDVFSAGVLFYMMLTGKNPFEATDFSSVLDAVVRREVPPIEDIPPAIWAVIEKAIQRDPAARFADATEMSIALRKAAGRKATTESNPVLPVGPISSPSLGDGPSGSHERLSMAPGTGQTGAHELSPGARRRRLIVASVVGISVAILVVAAITALVRPSSAKASAKTAAVANVAPVEPPETAATASATAEPPIEPPKEEAPRPAPDAAPEPPPAEPAVVAAGAQKPRATPAAKGRKQPGPVAAPARGAPAKGRKPGQEPNIARDPGF